MAVEERGLPEEPGAGAVAAQSQAASTWRGRSGSAWLAKEGLGATSGSSQDNVGGKEALEGDETQKEIHQTLTLSATGQPTTRMTCHFS